MNKVALLAGLLVFGAFWADRSVGWSQTGAQPSAQVKLTAAGSGANLALTRLLAEAYTKDHPQVVIDIPGSIGTTGAVKAVSAGVLSFGLISRPLKAEEKALGLIALEYARVPILIGVHPSVPDREITGRELVEIFKGTKTKWRNGKEIIVCARESGDSGFAALEAHIPGFKAVNAESLKANRWTLYFTDQDANQALASVPNAVGVCDLGMMTTEHLLIHPLLLDGVRPDPENVANGTYPLVRTLAFVYRQGNLAGEAKAFFAFVFSGAGKDILKRYNYLPVPEVLHEPK